MATTAKWCLWALLFQVFMVQINTQEEPHPFLSTKYRRLDLFSLCNTEHWRVCTLASPSTPAPASHCAWPRCVPAPAGKSLSREAPWVFLLGWAFREHLGGKVLGLSHQKGNHHWLRIQWLGSTLWKYCHLWVGDSSCLMVNPHTPTTNTLDVLLPSPPLLECVWGLATRSVSFWWEQTPLCQVAIKTGPFTFFPIGVK